MNNIDERGFPGTEGEDGQFDGGDTAAIVGNLIALADEYKFQPVFQTPLTMMRAMLIRDNGPVRHPDESKWWGQPDRFSRDQLIPLLCSFVQSPSMEQRKLFYFHEKNNFMWAWNTKKNGAMDVPTKTPDFTGPEIWALWARARQGPRWLKCLLLFLDIETLVGSLIWRYRSVFGSKNRVSRNHMLVCITGMKRFPSLTMRLAYHLNDWPDLLKRWEDHCVAVKEYPTAPLFRQALGYSEDVPVQSP